MPAEQTSLHRTRGVQQGKCHGARTLEPRAPNPHEYCVFYRKFPNNKFHSMKSATLLLSQLRQNEQIATARGAISKSAIRS
jgi:hypothetical protein